MDRNEVAARTRAITIRQTANADTTRDPWAPHRIARQLNAVARRNVWAERQANQA